MSGMIKDGSGKGYLAQVDSDNMLKVKAATLFNTHVAMLKGDLYWIVINFKQVSGGTTELACHFTYTGSRSLILHRFLTSSQDPGLATVSFIAGPTFSSGGYLVPPVNLNTASSKTLPCTNYIQLDGVTPFVGATFGATLYQTNIYGGGTYDFDARDSLLIKPNYPIGCSVNCSTTNSLVRMYAGCYELDV